MSFSRSVLTLFVPADGLTHWSLTGSTMTREDTFMGFSDGLSQSGILITARMPPPNNMQNPNKRPILVGCQWCQQRWR